MAGKTMKKHFIPPTGLMLLIFILSSIPMDGGPDKMAFLTGLDPTLQNLLHIPLYGSLAFLWLYAFVSSGVSLRKAIVFSILITMGYGCMDEFYQSFVPGRYGGILDIILNSLGAGAGLFIGTLWYRRFRGYHL